MVITRSAASLAALVLLAACGGESPQQPAAPPSPAPTTAEPTGTPLSTSDIAGLAALFADQP
ncbi:hypothetical protein [Actinokineospora sp.]|uniref:hypothetical protein n=1 Tax=Actinokineospora sp. TaxID=1872133 RepID=UPI003D6BB5EA